MARGGGPGIQIHICVTSKPWPCPLCTLHGFLHGTGNRRIKRKRKTRGKGWDPFQTEHRANSPFAMSFFVSQPLKQPGTMFFRSHVSLAFMTRDRNHTGKIITFKCTLVSSSSPTSKQMWVRVIYLRFLLAGN